MKLQVFHAGDGDCVLLTATRAGGKTSRILVDGGRKASFESEARDTVYAEPLDLVVVSHIDDDHISGILRLVEDALEHRLNRARVEMGEATDDLDFPEPEIRWIWHNTVYDLLGDDLAPRVHEALVSSANLLAGSSLPELRDLAAAIDNLATGEQSAMELSRRISAQQLDIVRNHDDGGLVLAGEGNDEIEIGEGGLKLSLLGPRKSDLQAMKTAWKTWIDDKDDIVRDLRRKLRDAERELDRLDASVIANPVLAAELGAGKITKPNLASLMFVASDDDGHTVLMTGDGSSEAILEGLGLLGLLDDDGRIHVDVLKVQHHGALANVTEAFVDRVTADHYVFCGNGAHHNPEPEVVEAFVRARLGDDPVGPERPFLLHFTSSEKSDISPTRKKHMKALRELLEGLKDELDSEDLGFRFIKDGHLEIML